MAPELGISDVALRKQCVKHAVPYRMPPIGDGCTPDVRSSAIHSHVRLFKSQE